MNHFNLPEQIPRSNRRMLPKLSRFLFRLFGWSLRNQIPNVNKAIIIGAPHTSNWDILPAALVIYGLDIKTTILAKDRLFNWWIVRAFLKTLGATPIKQSGNKNYVEQFKKTVEDAEKMILIIAPEGTRKKNKEWRTSFLYMAYATKVPVIGAVLDYGNKIIHVNKIFELSGDPEQDMAMVKAYYRKFRGLKVDNQG